MEPNLISLESLVSLLTLSAMEIVLGIDNVVFLSILAGKLPAEQQGKARKLGLGLALATRIGLLFAISWLAHLTTELFRVMDKPFSGRDLILLGGGLFLMGKAAHEIYESLEAEAPDEGARSTKGSFGMVLFQILVMDVIFSLDSVITAVGMAQHLTVMVAAMVVAMVFMLFFAGTISGFVSRHPSMKMLALSFLLLIGVMLAGDGLGHHIPKGYIYFAMAFSVGIEILNMRLRRKHRPVMLHSPLEGRESTRLTV
jgi:predicted tellurium resistance membrane protein TerC